MDDHELLKTELSAQGISISDDDMCTSVRNGERSVVSIEEQINNLTTAIRENKQLVRSIWQEMVEFLPACKTLSLPSGELTQKMFINTMRMLNRSSRRFKSLANGRQSIKTVMNGDVANFGEIFMSRIIEYGMGFAWVHHLIRQDMYCIDLLKKYSGQTKTAANAGGFYGTFPLETRERVWKYDEDKEDEENDSSGNSTNQPHMREDLKQTDPVYQFWARRHKLPDTYNDPYSFEEGFVWREMRNDPYEFDDQDENPYPHRNLLWKA